MQHYQGTYCFQQEGAKLEVMVGPAKPCPKIFVLTGTQIAVQYTCYPNYTTTLGSGVPVPNKHLQSSLKRENFTTFLPKILPCEEV